MFACENEAMTVMSARTRRSLRVRISIMATAGIKPLSCVDEGPHGVFYDRITP